jgi:hypothetical protein
MTEADNTAAFLKAINIFVREEILKAFTPLRERLDELEKRGVDYKGTFQRACSYRRGDIVTHDGSMFVAIGDVAPNEAPGNGGNWQLAVKRGQDAVQPRSPTRSATRVG